MMVYPTKSSIGSFRVLLTALVAISLPLCACSGTNQQLAEYAGDGEFGAAIARSEALVAARIEEGIPGFSVAVAVEGEIVWQHAAGLADVDNSVPATAATQFRIGSTSKSITAVLAARLREQDLIDLDSDIRKVLPAFPEKRYTITLRDLLSMQAGIRHYEGNESRNRKHYASVEEGLEVFENDSLLFEPHTFIHYSSYSFNLAGAVLARAAQTSFAALVDREVFDPLEMRSATIDDPQVDIPNRAISYSSNARGLRLADVVDDAYKAPSGGLLATPADIVKLGIALVRAYQGTDESFLRLESVRELFQDRKIADGRSGKYALGFRVQPADSTSNPPAPYAVHHGGSSVGGRSMFLIWPEEEIVVSLLCNTDDYDHKEDDAGSIAGFFAEIASLRDTD